MSSLKRNLIATAAIIMGCLLSELTSAQSEGSPELLQARDEGIAALKAEDWEGAIAAADRGIALDSDGLFTAVYFIKAEALRELEDYANAIKFNTQALQADDTFAQAYNSRGICLRELGQMELALNDFRNASEYDRNDPLIAANLGDILVNTYQKPAEALTYLDRAIEKNPQDAEAYRNRGRAHAMLKEFEDGVADLDKAIQLDPNDYKTYQIIASVHLAEEEYQLAIDAISKAIEYYKPKESSEPDTYINGYQLRAETRLKLAKEKTTTPEQSRELYDGVIADADAILTEFPDRFPESGVALYFRGKALRMQEKFAAAITALTDAIQLIPPGRDSGYVGEAYLTRGICWFYQGQNSLARGDFKEAASQSLEDPRPHLWLGFTAAKEGEYRKAID